jgi:hypothetical protein
VLALDIKQRKVGFIGKITTTFYILKLIFVAQSGKSISDLKQKFRQMTQQYTTLLEVHIMDNH